MHKKLGQSLIPAITAIFLTACGPEKAVRNEYPVGEKVPVGQLVYSVVETTWKSQLGTSLKIRTPQRRFLLVTLSVTNSGGHDVSIPLLQIEDANGKTYTESENGDSVDDWFGLLRNINPAETQQGKLLFDVPLTSYRLRVTDAGEPGSEKYAYIQMPLRMDIDTQIQVPQPGGGLR